MSKEIERRFIQADDAEVRAVKGDGGKVGIRGTAAVTNSMSVNLGRFHERIAPGAFDKALAKADIRGLFNHNPDYVLGRMKPGTMRVWADDKGLHYDIPELPASRADVAEAIERGDVSGNSFSFIVAEGGDRMETRDGMRVRTITDIEEILDVGPVTFPAYEATRVSKRALDLAEKVEEIAKDPEHPAHSEIPDYSLEHQKLLLAEAEQDG